MSGSNLLATAEGLRFGSARDGPIESCDEERLCAVPVGVGDQLDGFLVVDPVEAHEDDRVVVVGLVVKNVSGSAAARASRSSIESTQTTSASGSSRTQVNIRRLVRHDGRPP